MTTIADIEDVWDDNIWNDESILAIQPEIKVYRYLLGDDGEPDNAVEFVVRRAEKAPQVCQGTSSTSVFEIEIRYTRECDDEDEADSIAIRDFFDNLMPLVRTKLGKTWSDTVDLWNFQKEPVRVSPIIINQEDFLQGRLILTAEKTV